MKRIPKILAAGCAAVVLSASLVLAAGAAAPAMSSDAAPADGPAAGAAMPMQGAMLKGSMMQGGQRGSMPMGSMLSEEKPNSGHGGGHGSGDGHNRAGHMTGMNGMGRMSQSAMPDRS